MKARFSTLLGLLLGVMILIISPGAAVQAAPPGARRPPETALTQVEIDGLRFMREEEKLAHDVYVVLYAKWGLTTFANISSAESNHMAAIKNLLDRYGIADPASGNPVGKFTDPDLQALYDDLIVRGNPSLSEALKVGGAIEEIDILDLEKRLASTRRSDILNVYNNLIAGSCNHLRAFSTNLQRRTGEVYQPQYLSLDVYQAIINGTY